MQSTHDGHESPTDGSTDTEIDGSLPFDERDGRRHGGIYERLQAGGGLGGVDLPPYVFTEIDGDQTSESDIQVLDTKQGISLDVDLHLSDGGRVGTLVHLDAETATALGEALLEAADTEYMRDKEGVPAAVDDTLEGS